MQLISEQVVYLRADSQWGTVGNNQASFLTNWPSTQLANSDTATYDTLDKSVPIYQYFIQCLSNYF
jgi:hypothetical protein